MSPVSYLTSLECSITQSPDNSNSFSIISHWLEFIFLSPCPQRFLFSAINLAFMLTLIALALKRLYSRFLIVRRSGDLEKPLLASDHSPSFRITFWFKVSFIVTALLALSYAVLCILAFTLSQGVRSQWNLVEILFRLFQAMTNMVILVILTHEKKFRAVSHPMPLRMYWAVSFCIACLFATASLTRLCSVSVTEYSDQNTKVDDVFSLAIFPLYLCLFIVSIKGCSGIQLSVEEDVVENSRQECNNLTGYATASLLSRAVWHWIEPVLEKGYKSPLQIDDVPFLAPDHQALRMSQNFQHHWPENSKNPVRTMLLRCFRKDLALTGILDVVRLAAVYAGPVLIKSFIGFTSGDRSRSSLYKGFYLILILFAAKSIEVLSSHQGTFLSYKLGLLIRSTLITALYKKGLRLTSSSRQAHGVGQIVNYMAVDCEQLSELVHHLHTLWMMPFQVGVAVLLLYVYIGVSTLPSLAVIAAVMFLTLKITNKKNAFMQNVMKNRDARIKATAEMLNNMRVIKFQGWEEHFFKKIKSAREEEYSWLSSFMFMSSGNEVLLWGLPDLISVLIFVVAGFLRVRLDAVSIFTAMTVFKILQEPIQIFPQILSSVSQAIVSLKRLDGYLTSWELEDENVEREEECRTGIAVEVREGAFSWDDEGGECVLENVNFEVKKGEVAAIVGTVGSGKSSLLASVLGELRKISGKVRVCGTTAYVAQTSWIQNATIQENILFGSPMDNEKYKDVIKVCSLEKDLMIMEHGDQTEIGENGINLSGGQKQRIQLARAVYQDCDIYLLDDIFSAVDAHTGTEIFKECVRGALKDKTILLVTHQVDFLQNADLILVVKDGKIVQRGKYEELRYSGLDFSALLEAHEISMELVETNTQIKVEKVLEPSGTVSSPNESNTEPAKKGTSKLIEDEERETGRVDLNVYKQYCTEAYGWWGISAVILASVLMNVSNVAADYWLAYETSQSRKYVASVFIGVYSGIAIVSCIFLVIRSVLVTVFGLQTAQSFFNQMLNTVLHAPISFFDTTPSGRVLSRASSDQVNIDIWIPYFLSIFIVVCFSLLTILVMTCIFSWPTIFFIFPSIWLNIWLQGYYIATSRELTRLEQITKAPIIHHFSETVSGVATIRCFRNQDKSFQENIDRINAYMRMCFHYRASNAWLGFRLEMIGSCLLFVATFCLILLPSSIIKPGYVGLILSYGLSLSSVMYYVVYIGSFLQNKMVSVERIKQFANIPFEAAWRKADFLSSPDWPNRGHIEIKDLQVRYRHNTPLVLKGMSLSISGGEKVGIVGRTGSGKSTLIQVFFRLVEPYAGAIIIDGVDICELGLHDLRSRLGIIPQEPALFEGTVRSNIDPLGLYTDDEIWKSLERCQLKEVVSAKPEKLDSIVVDSGENWSVGQKQLLCLGRVMLKRTKILFMDEATASVDSQTDAVIQRIIRQDFSACTVITIAHRIPTIIDCDRVLVIDEGLAKEFDNPAKLLEKRSLFGALVREHASRSSGL